MDAQLQTPPPFLGYQYHQQHPVILGYPSSSAVVPGELLSSQQSVGPRLVASVHPNHPPTDISFPAEQSILGMDPPVSTGGFDFADPGTATAPIDPLICPERVRSNTDSFEHTTGLQGAASTPSTGKVQAPARAPGVDFYTDLDFPYGSNLSPIHMVDASRGVNQSQDNYTTYQMQFDQDPNGPSTSICQFGTHIGRNVELCFENINNHNIYQDRYVLLCRCGAGKIYGLEICPLLLALKDHNTDHIIHDVYCQPSPLRFVERGTREYEVKLRLVCKHKWLARRGSCFFLPGRTLFQ